MISPASIDEKELVPIGSALADLNDLPAEVRSEAMAALTDLQNGRRPAKNRYKDLTGNQKLDGVGEIRLDDDGNTFRIYNVVVYREVIYLLDAGMKKSVRGGAIPQQDLRRLELRRKAAAEDYEAKKPFYTERYEERARRRQNHLGRIQAKMLALNAPKPKGT